MWRCYHCEVGRVEGAPPGPAEETVAKSALALRLMVERARRQPLTDDEQELRAAVTRDLLDALGELGLPAIANYRDAV